MGFFIGNQEPFFPGRTKRDVNNGPKNPRFGGTYFASSPCCKHGFRAVLALSVP